MLQNYIKTALRNLTRNWSYSLTNIIGLSVGLASSIFILVFVIHELSYDDFHQKSHRTYRMGVEGKLGANSFTQAVTAAPMAQAMVDDYPEVEQAVRLREAGAWLIRYGEKKFNENHVLFADSTFFQVFSFRLLKGDPAQVLADPRSLVMTTTTARKYFGDDDPVGKTLQVESDSVLWTVTGVMEDVPQNSHLDFEMLGSLNTLGASRNTFWLSHNFYTYVVLQEGTDPGAFENKLDIMVDKYVGPQVQQALGVSMEDFLGKGNAVNYFMQPVPDIHLKSDIQYELQANSDIKYVYIFSFIALLIVLLASINYMNMATAKSASRSVEVGMRKVVGGTRRSLRLQFLLESVVLTLASLLIAIILVELLIPRFNNMIQLSLDVPYFEVWYILPGLLILAMLVGLLAGTYPAFFLSSFHPVAVLKGRIKQGARSGRIRKVLVTSQFVISIAIMLATFTVYDQLSYMQGKDPGFEKENILVIRRSDGLRDNMESFKQEVRKFPNVVSVTNAVTMPGKNFSNNAFFVPGSPETKLLHQAWISFDFEKVFDLEMAKGRFFSRDYPSDSSAIVINQKAVENLGFGDDPIGKILLYPAGENGEMDELRVIGVVKDFHFKSMHSPVEPAAFNIMRGNWEGYVIVRLLPGQQSNTVNQIQQTWDSFTSEYPFEYFFFKEDYHALYASEERTSKILVVFSILSVVIAGLGLLGLISFTTLKRQKEIGIRKSFGSTTTNILVLLNREIVLLIGYAIFIAWPLAFYAMNRWLQDFSYRTQINLQMFVWIPAIILLLALVIVSVQSYQAASKNPAHTLRYE